MDWNVETRHLASSLVKIEVFRKGEDMLMILGLLLSAVGGWIANKKIIDEWLWPIYEASIKGEGVQLNYNKKDDRLIVSVLGIFERILYTFAIIVGRPEWIAVWLTLKISIKWHGWEKDQKRSYNIFLIGNAISVLFGFLGACLALWGLPVRQ